MDSSVVTKSIASIVSLNEEEWEQLSDYMEVKTLKKTICF